MVAQGVVDVPSGGGTDALVDRERLPQAGGGFGGVAVQEVAVAESFQGTRFLKRGAEVAGDGQRLGVVVAGLAAIGGAGR